MVALCTQTEVERYGQVDFTNTPEDAVTLWIRTASEMIEDHCGWLFTKVTGEIVTLDGRARAIVKIPHYPISTINSLTEDGETLVEGTDFVVRPASGQIVRIDSNKQTRSWVGELQAIVVNYDAGYADATDTPAADEPPDALRHTAAAIVGRIFRAGAAWAASPVGAGEVRQINLAGVGSAQFAPSSVAAITMTDDVALTSVEKRRLSKYVRRGQ